MLPVLVLVLFVLVLFVLVLFVLFVLAVVVLAVLAVLVDWPLLVEAVCALNGSWPTRASSSSVASITNTPRGLLAKMGENTRLRASSRADTYPSPNAARKRTPRRGTQAQSF